MEKDANQIRREIEETRERLGQTVEALAHQADVPARAKDAVHERVESAKHTVADVLTSTAATVSDVARNAQAKIRETLGS